MARQNPFDLLVSGKISWQKWRNNSLTCKLQSQTCTKQTCMGPFSTRQTFHGADLTEANLQDADLSEANCAKQTCAMPTYRIPI